MSEVLRLDHGVLNTPLAKRSKTLFGETRAQLDARVVAEAKAKKSAYIALYAEASGLLEMVSDERMEALGKPHGMNARKTRKVWHGIAKRAPATVIAALRKEIEAARPGGAR